MKKMGFMATVAILFFSCGKKVYRNDDYSFREENFSAKASKIRTDGVYVLTKIESSAGTKSPENHQFYVFFENGQVNLTVDLHREINSEEMYLQSIERHVAASNSEQFKTHFEGYFKVENNKIVLQKMNVPRKVFNYSFGFVDDQKLTIVSRSLNGNDAFADKHFNSNYKETWEFLPLNAERLQQLKPGW